MSVRPFPKQRVLKMKVGESLKLSGLQTLGNCLLRSVFTDKTEKHSAVFIGIQGVDNVENVCALVRQ